MPDPGSIQGATALKLDEEIKTDTVPKKQEDLVSGVSLENAAYFENNSDKTLSDQNSDEQQEIVIDDISLYEEKPSNDPDTEYNQDEISPQLFSDEDNSNASSESKDETISKNGEEEDFEIPAFLRKQKF